jgi:hypothetical protein
MSTGNDAALIDAMYVVSRGVVLVIAALGGCMSIFLGWKLYRDGVMCNTEGSANNANGWSFTLKSAGPGVFFAAFGMWLLIQLINQPLEMDDDVGTMPTNGQVETPVVHRSSADGIFQLAAMQTRNPIRRPSVCLVARRHRRMLDGDLSSEGVRRSLIVAIAALESRRGTLTGDSAAKLADTIDTLEQMKEATGEWEMGQ